MLLAMKVESQGPRLPPVLEIRQLEGRGVRGSTVVGQLTGLWFGVETVSVPVLRGGRLSSRDSV